jgi:hypothetical protein
MRCRILLLRGESTGDFTWPGWTDTLNAITQPPEWLGTFLRKGRAFFMRD